MGLTFARGERQLIEAGLAGAIGTAETNMVELTAAYGAHRQRRNAARRRERSWRSATPTATCVPLGENSAHQVLSEQAAWLMTDILKDSTDPLVNNIFGPRLQIVNVEPDPLHPRQRTPLCGGQDGHDQRPA